MDDTSRVPIGRESGGRRASAPAGLISGRLGVRPARLVRRSSEDGARAQAALRVLYRDFLTAGGLDIARASRSPSAPAARRSQR